MKTIKLKIMNKFNCVDELRLFNSIVCFSYNRFKEGLKEIEVRSKCREIFKGNSWFVQCAIKEGQVVFDRFKEKITPLLSEEFIKILDAVMPFIERFAEIS